MILSSLEQNRPNELCHSPENLTVERIGWSYIPFHHVLSHCQEVGGKYFKITVIAEHQEIIGISKSWSQMLPTGVN